MAVVARLLRGEPLELVARETIVSIAKLTEWRPLQAFAPAPAVCER
jgi:transposase